MTLTLPTHDAGETARQRFALELLLQQPVPGPEQLLASRYLLEEALPDVGPSVGERYRPCRSPSVLSSWTSRSPASGEIRNGNT